MGARNYSPPAVGNLLLYPGYGPMARRLAVQLFWMMRKEWDYEQLKCSVRTRDSPEIAMVCSRTPSN